MPRLFVAVDLPPERIQTLRSLRDDHLDARWTPEEQYHVTLRFLGSVDDETTAMLAENLERHGGESFEMHGEGVDVFPSLRKPRVLVVSIDRHPALMALQRSIDGFAMELGIERDPKPFNPHVTLARLSERSRPSDVRAYLERNAEFIVDSFPVTRFHLYRSDTKPTGALHTILRSYNLEPET